MKQRWFIYFLVLFFPLYADASDRILNVYAYTGEIPEFAIRQFEKESGIKVNFSTYENNEIMYAKIRATTTSGYDVIIPTSYFVERMRKNGMLERFDKSKLPNWKNLNPEFLHASYDPESAYSAPHIWGITGIFTNQQFFPAQTITKWSDLWEPRFREQLMLVDDMREVFAMGLLSLGYSANDQNPEHIKEAFLKLKDLMKNVKVFSSDTTISIMIDEDATVGMAWNGDAYKAHVDNTMVNFVFPKEGFAIWVDNFVILKNAPHKNEAYEFITFMQRADVAKNVALSISFPIANLAGLKLLPPEVRNSPIAYPPKDILKHGEYLLDVNSETLAIYEKYWEELKISS